MLSGVGLTQEILVEAINTTRYLLNMLPSLVLVEKTPHEVSYSNKPSV
jgi:hypothetical protein